MSYNEFHALCAMHLDRVHDVVRNDPTLKQYGHVISIHDTAFQFRFYKPLKIIDNNGKQVLVYSISIAIPEDVCRDRSNREYVFDRLVYETILFQSPNKLCYIDELGYSDTNRFNTIREVIAEIIRIAEIACGLREISDNVCDDDVCDDDVCDDGVCDDGVCDDER